MKNRSKLTIFTTLLSVLACFGLLSIAQAQDDDDVGNANTTAGFHSLNSDSTGAFNAAYGWYSLGFNTDGLFNTAVGAGALDVNLNGNSNTAVGVAALLLNDGDLADGNTAVGTNALLFNSFSLTDPATAVENTGVGEFALSNNVDGGQNTAVGALSLQNILTGHDNVAVGWSAGQGYTSAESGNIVIGSGELGAVGETNAIRIGSLKSGAVGATLIRIADNTGPATGSTSRVFIGGINGANVGAAGATVVVGTAGQLGTIISSARYKKDIESMGKSSEVIFSLRPVSFHYKGDETNLPCFGLIAEEVAKVNPALILRDDEGKPNSVRYEQINAMLLNEFLKEHKKVEEQQASISQLKSEMQTMVAQLKEQAAQIQRVSAQLEVRKRAPQVVANKP